MNSFGRIEFLHPAFHNEKHIWPLEYKATSLRESPNAKTQESEYVCEILAAPENSGPLFRWVSKTAFISPMAFYKVWNRTSFVVTYSGVISVQEDKWIIATIVCFQACKSTGKSKRAHCLGFKHDACFQTLLPYMLTTLIRLRTSQSFLQNHALLLHIFTLVTPWFKLGVWFCLWMWICPNSIQSTHHVIQQVVGQGNMSLEIKS